MINEDLLSRLSDLKREAESSKSKLDGIILSEEAGGGLVRISMNGNRKLQSLEINGDLKSIDKEDLEDLISVALTRVLDKVNEINEKEVMNSAQSLFSGM